MSGRLDPRKQFGETVKADLAARGLTRKPRFAGWRRPLVHFTYLLRLAERYRQSRSLVGRGLGRYYAFRARRAGMRLGVLVPPGVCGPGLHIVHWGSLVISGQARIGSNCRIHSDVNIGAFRGGAPRIGDDVYIGPGAKIFGAIEIGDRSVIGANAVVNRSFPADSVLVGVPARAVPPKAQNRATAGGDL
ncbi:MAG: serine acetyltransferase [Pseudomonadota bacterium]